MNDSSLKLHRNNRGQVRGLLALLIASALIIVLIGKPKRPTQPQFHDAQSPKLEAKASPSPAVPVRVDTKAEAQEKTKPTSPATPQSPDSPSDAVSKVLSKNVSMEERRVALYELTQNHSDEATQSLIQIAASNVEAQDESSRFDVSLRITALEAIDQRMTNGEATASAINTVLEKQKHPTLLFFARISLEGVTAGRPGKLTRFIDKAFSEVGAG